MSARTWKALNTAVRAMRAGKVPEDVIEEVGKLARAYQPFTGLGPDHRGKKPVPMACPNCGLEWSGPYMPMDAERWAQAGMRLAGCPRGLCTAALLIGQAPEAKGERA